MDDELFRRGPGWFAVCFIAAVTSFATVAAYHWASRTGRLAPESTMPAAPAPAATTLTPQNPAVPALAGLPSEVARELLGARGLRLVVRERREHETLPPDAVISQDPLSNSVVSAGSAVTVTVSTGQPASAGIPDVAGQTLSQAKQALEAAGFSVAKPAASDPEDGVVEATVPAAGQRAARRSAVKLVLAIPTSEIPKVVGMSVPQARKVLESAGFKLGKIREGEDDVTEQGIIFGQTPQAGARAAKGSVVELMRRPEY